MFLLKRLIANFVDVFVFVAIVVLFMVVVLPFFLVDGDEGVFGLVVAGGGLVLICGLVFLVQYPFLRINQTIGKAFVGLRIVSTNDRRPLTIQIILQREIFAKVLTCYFMCIPVLFGKEGQHDVACETEVV